MNIFNKYTLKILRKNKTRTLVTIIGIILSASMICAVTSLATSLQSFLLQREIANDGDWHGAVYNISSEELAKLQGNDKILNYCTLQNIGYSILEEGINDSKPYLAVLGIDSSFEEMMPIHLIKGRLPENNTEIILPKHLATNGGVKYQLGDVLELSLGERLSNGEKLYQNTSYLSGKYGSEELIPTITRTYQVVGFYERPSFESYTAPGYSALTLIDETASDSYSSYIKMNNPKDIYEFIKENFKDYSSSYNYDVLRFIGASDETSYNGVLYGLSTILIAIIMLASISLIYNAFSISISERIKQFGLLSSIGATKRQLMKSVMFEASFLSIIGIPLGILAGLTGIGITLSFTKNLFVDFLVGNANDPSVTLNLKVTPLSILTTAIIAFITILISAYIPARKAVQISNIEAIRQTHDITIKSRSVKTSKLTYKVFGFEGMIASKNFKRNRRKYRATVFSLFVSVVLFITASSYCAYLKKSSSAIVNPPSYDITYYYDTDANQDNSISEIYSILSSINGVTKSSYSTNRYSDVRINAENLSKEYLDYYKKFYAEYYDTFNDQEMNTNVRVSFINDDDYAKYLEENGFDKDKYMNSENPVAIACDFIKRYNDGKYYTYHLFNNSNPSMDLLEIKEIEGYFLNDIQKNDSGETIYKYQEENNEYDVEIRGEDIYYTQKEPDSPVETLEFTEDEVLKRIPLTIGEVTDVVPLNLEKYKGDLIIMYPYSAIPSILGSDYEVESAELYFKTTDHKLVYDSMYKELDERGISTSQLFDVAASADTDRAMLIIINVFSYGFITLISLISAANVFNTISTNISLRRREFAMLKSIGMTQKGFHKMMNYECILYGFKGLLYGLPVSILITYFIYRSVLNGWETTFFIPTHSILIAIVSVFIVVFSTMLYSMSQIKKDNTIDTLKNENI